MTGHVVEFVVGYDAGKWSLGHGTEWKRDTSYKQWIRFLWNTAYV